MNDYVEAEVDALLYGQPPRPSIQRYLHVGRGDDSHEQHVLPYVEYLERFGVHFSLDVGEYTSHGESGVFFPRYIEAVVSKLWGDGVVRALLGSGELADAISASYDCVSGCVTASAETKEHGTKLAFYLYLDDKVFEKRPYSLTKQVRFEVPFVVGRVYVRAFFLKDQVNYLKINSNVINLV